MELVKRLQELGSSKKAGKKTLRPYGINSGEEFIKPLAEMVAEKAMCIIVNWLVNNATPGYEIPLRVPDSLERQIYEAELVTKGRTIYITNIRKAPELIGKLLHCWDEGTNYNTLTMEKIMYSSEHADLIESFPETDNVSKELKVLKCVRSNA